MGQNLIDGQQFVIFMIGCALNYAQLPFAFGCLVTWSSGQSRTAKQLKLLLYPDNKVKCRKVVFFSYKNNTND